MNENELIDLLRRFEQGECTPDEQAQIEDWYNKASASSSAPFPELVEREKRIWGQVKPKRHFPFVKYAAAVIVLIGVSYAGYFVMQPSAAVVRDVQPGGNSAMLTLGDGKSVSLNSFNGKVNTNPQVSVSNNSGNGVITYQLANTKHADLSNEINTITTPRGGQYQLVLSDGTHVFLNSSSTLQFSVRFATKERKVTLVGEGYFEVAKDPKRPFIVNTKEQQLKVLGTHFNVSAYPNEITKSTLAEGSVELISSSLNKQLLKPNQQASLLSGSFQVKDVKAADEIAWKDGLFIFKRTPLDAALNKLSLWYNVEVDYSSIPDLTLDAVLSRTNTLTEQLEAISFSTGVKINLSEDGKLKVVK